MSTSDFLTSLYSRFGESRVLVRDEDILPYGFDGTAALKQRPDCVFFPQGTEEVAEVLKIAKEHRKPVVTRGSGTGLSGGSIPVAGAVVVCLAKMDRILEVDAANLTLRAEAGAVTQKIYDAADSVGLFYPPDPGSMKISTIGGNIAENSGGLRGLKYGVTRDYVMGLEVVLADGSICWVGSACVKDVAGYNLRDLFIGSEGTLGVVAGRGDPCPAQAAAKTCGTSNFAGYLFGDGRSGGDGFCNHRREDYTLYSRVS